MNKTIYIFSDWSMTIHKILNDDTSINKEFGKMFVSSLKNLSKVYNCNIKLTIVSGCTNKQAQNRFNKLSELFHEYNMDDYFNGVAYEYGNFLITKEKNCQFQNYFLSESDIVKIKKLANKYHLIQNTAYNSYLCFESESGSKDYRNFCKSCYENCPNNKIVTYDDEQGTGIDIKNINLRKETFILNYLKEVNDVKFVITGGDDEEDTKLPNLSKKYPTYNITFGKKTEENHIATKKTNILGIIDGINQIAELNSKNKEN